MKSSALLKLSSITWKTSSNTEEVIGAAVSILNLLVFGTVSYFRRNSPFESTLVSLLHWCGPLLLSTLLAGFVTFHIFTVAELNLPSTVVLAIWAVIFFAVFAYGIFTCKQRKPELEGNVEFSEPLLGNAELNTEERKDRPECFEIVDVDKEPIWRIFSFWWMNKFLAHGYRKTWTIEDCPRLGQRDQASVQYERFRAFWELRGRKHPETKQSLVWVLWDTFWPQMLFNGFMAMIYLVCLYSGPVMLGVLVRFVGREDRTAFEGVALVGILLLAKVTQALAERRWYFGVERLGVWIRSALVTNTYRKGLRLSNSAKGTHGSGEIVNYLSVDVEKIVEFMWWMHDTWLLPTQAVIAFVILFATVGWAALAGMGIIFVCIGLQVPLARQTEKIQTKVMAAKDARLKVTTEYLKGMRVIKLWAWEDSFRGKLESLRAAEFRFLTLNAALKTANIFLIYLCPLLVALVTLGVCVLIGEPLTSAKVFTAIATFRILQDPLFLLPLLIVQLAEASVSLTRLQTLFHSEELQNDAVEKVTVNESLTDSLEIQSKPVISIEDGTFSWGRGRKNNEKASHTNDDSSGFDEGKKEKDKLQDEDRVILHDIFMEVGRGGRVAICGTVGSGKSSLLSCILGEMTKLSGKVRVQGKVAYVPQSPWIQSGTIEANILFGEKMDRQRYEEAISVCSLKPDLRVLPGADKTEIGERGINVSGGQKQRIQLARAVYQNADIYLLDDPFSAVDAHTGTELFKECVMGALANKTVILVTHQVEFLPAVDMILVMREGRIVQRGRYDELLSAGTDFSALVDAHNEAMNTVDNVEKGAKSESLEAVLEEVLGGSQKDGAESTVFGRSPSLSRTGSERGLLLTDRQREVGTEGEWAELVEEEESEMGAVGLEVYVAYLRGFWGGTLVPFILLALVAYQATQISGNFWLSYAVSPENRVNPRDMIRVYAWLTSGGVLFVLIRTVAVNFGGVLTAQGFFLGMLRAIFRAPMSFFDTTPTGRILARVSSDQTRLDLDIPQSFSGALRNMMELAGILFVTSFITPQMLLASIPCGVAVILLQSYYLKSSRELTRVAAICQAPILNNFSESVTGAATIRASEKSSQFMKTHMDLVNVNNRPNFINSAASHWFMLRLEVLAATVFSLSAVLLVLLPSTVISPALAGLSLAYGLTLNEALCFWAWWSSQLENKIISVERIRQYTKLPQEAPHIIPDSRPPPHWPHEGKIEMQHLQVRYRENTPLVLRDLTCVVEGGEKVGVVGRTGSGKSTLILALFRVVEPAGGSIVIDGIDITKIGLKDLRERLSIIPQEPTLFLGSVRSNMDPLHEFTDSEIWEALDRCQLGDIVRGKSERLDASVSDSGENWSVGQRQLFCLGRALLKGSRILVLDEATASVDAATDALIQRTIAEHCSSCTVISIAHRIPTVIDSDKVLVLHEGRVAEYDSPKKLLEGKSSMFAKLVAEYAKRSGSMADLASLSRIQSEQNLEGLS